MLHTTRVAVVADQFTADRLMLKSECVFAIGNEGVSCRTLTGLRGLFPVENDAHLLTDMCAHLSWESAFPDLEDWILWSHQDLEEDYGADLASSGDAIPYERCREKMTPMTLCLLTHDQPCAKKCDPQLNRPLVCSVGWCRAVFCLSAVALPGDLGRAVVLTT